MTKREQRRLVRENRRRLYLDAWAKQETQGTALTVFCRSYGLEPKTLYRWMKRAGTKKTPAIQRVDPALKKKALEIYLRYRGTWGAGTIALALGNRISAWTVGRTIREQKAQHRAPAARPVAPSPRGEKAERKNQIWAIDWTEYRIGGRPLYVAFMIDEASRFCLGWEVFQRPPDAEKISGFVSNVFDRYEAKPQVIKSDGARVFVSAEWERLLTSNGVAVRRGRPSCPQDQGSVERFIREATGWIKASVPENAEKLSVCVDEGVFMLNFLKPKAVLEGRTPAAAYLSRDEATVLEVVS